MHQQRGRWIELKFPELHYPLRSHGQHPCSRLYPTFLTGTMGILTPCGVILRCYLWSGSSA